MAGFVLGICQMLLYIVYKYVIKNPETNLKQHEETKESPVYPCVDKETEGLELKVVVSN